MEKNRYAPATAKSYISGLSFKMKILGLKDTTNSFIIQKMLAGMQRLHKRVDARKPITFDILSKIIFTLQKTCSSFYETLLFASCFSLAFFGFLRVGEFAQSACSDRHVLHVSDISFKDNMMFITLPSSKTDQMANKTRIEIPNYINQSICPVQNMKRYLKVRPKIAGSLYCHLNNKILTRYQVSAMLKRSLKYLNFKDDDYNTHSFRIGAATSFAKLGKSDQDIQKMGRWKSYSYQRYIRMNFVE